MTPTTGAFALYARGGWWNWPWISVGRKSERSALWNDVTAIVKAQTDCFFFKQRCKLLIECAIVLFVLISDSKLLEFEILDFFSTRVLVLKKTRLYLQNNYNNNYGYSNTQLLEKWPQNLSTLVLDAQRWNH